MNFTSSYLDYFVFIKVITTQKKCKKKIVDWFLTRNVKDYQLPYLL